MRDIIERVKADIHAYDQKYLDDAMRNLGEAFAYAKNDCRIEMDDFMDCL
jgi:hypothetical protein